jgi:hypothetical protein
MSDDKSDKAGDWFGNPLPIVMVVLLAAGIVAETVQLESARPTDPERVKFVPTSQQDVEARLWQDPFAAVEKHKKSPDQAIAPTGNIVKKFSRPDFLKPPPRRHTPDVLLNRIKHLKGTVTILAVSLFGTSYAEEAESRRRSRFAVISALDFHGYHPEDADTIGYFHLDASKPQSSDSEPAYDDDVPYEWFGKEDTLPSVLVLWLKDEKLTSKPLTTLRNLSNKLKPSSHESIINVKLIGPAGSAVLRTLGDELKNDAPLQQDDRVIEVYSPSATISDCDFLKEQKIGCFKNSLALPNGNGRIIRTTGTDDVLADSLLWELWLRGVNRDPGYWGQLWKWVRGQDDTCEDGLVLIGERDTRYGRTLLGYLTNGFSARCGSENQVRRFSYLRGLDGVLADADKSGNKAPPKTDSGKSKDLREHLEDAPLEHAEGRSQFDYLRRLADEIDRLDKDKTFAKHGVKAIGLVGSDLYDKLLILQALRNRFKNTIFFTTDLDARYLHADQKNWTRNLVVASNFGLSLDSKLQDHTLPFRDSYQTARYLATLMALEKQDSQAGWTKQMEEWIRPQIFEIGRTEAVHLASPSVSRLKSWKKTYTENNPLSETTALCMSDWTECKSIEPYGLLRTLSPMQLLGGMLLLLGIGTPLIILANQHVNKTVRAATGPPSPERVAERKAIATVAIAVVVVAFIPPPLVLYYMNDSLTKGIGEPFVWLEGISAWPNLIIRFVGLFAVLGLWYLFAKNMRHQKNQISKDFELSLTTVGVLNRSRWSAVWTGPYLDLASSKKNGEVTTLWHNYLWATSVREMKWWIGTSIVITLASVFTIVSLWGEPSFPHRGTLVLDLHRFLFISHTIVFWLIIFWIGYEMRACVQFIDTLSGVRNTWSKPLLLRKAKETSISPTHLDDYLDFQLIVRTTQRVQSLIYLPFVSIFVLVLARSNFFAAMDLPLPFVLIVGFALAYLLCSARLLRKRAEAMHTTVLKNYETLQSMPTWPPIYTEKIDRLIGRIRNTNAGVLAPFAQQPALQALLLPFGGYGGVQIIEYLVKLFGGP